MTSTEDIPKNTWDFRKTNSELNQNNSAFVEIKYRFVFTKSDAIKFYIGQKPIFYDARNNSSLPLPAFSPPKSCRFVSLS